MRGIFTLTSVLSHQGRGGLLAGVPLNRLSTNGVVLRAHGVAVYAFLGSGLRRNDGMRREEMVGHRGLEPRTSVLSGLRSNRLS